MRSPDSSEIRKGTRKDGKQRKEEEGGREDSARMLSVQSDGGFPIKLQIKTHILLECQWVRGDITKVEGATEKWRKTGGRSTGRIASQQELSLPFPGGKKIFSSLAAPHRACPASAVPSVPRIPAIISSVIPQTSSEPRSNRIIPRGAATWPVPIHSPSYKTILHPCTFRLHLPLASRLSLDRPVTGFP